MKISVATMAHPDRYKAAKALECNLVAMPFSDVYTIYDDSNSEWDTGSRSLKWGIGKADWHIVLQDDAIVGKHFYENLCNAIENVPHESLISLYTGTVRPYPALVGLALQKAQKSEASWLSCSTLLWGVGIVVPSRMIESMLINVSRSPFVYDRRIGSHFSSMCKPVYYTNPSLVDHNYTLGSLIGNDRNPEPRVARNFVGDEIVEFNNKAVVIF